MPVSIRRLVLAVTLSCALVAGATGCGGGEPAASSPQADTKVNPRASAQALEAQAMAQMRAEADRARRARAEPTPTTSAEKQKFAKTRFVVNAGLAAGATYQWIVKPFRAGKFKKGADGRRVSLVKAGLAGVFAYNRLKAAIDNAKGDPTLAKAVAPLEEGIEKMKDLPKQLRSGDNTDTIVGNFDSIINDVKEAGKSAGAEVTDKVPSAGQLQGAP
ncbi:MULTISPECIES: hypothetical protein [Streptomyces]|uniref:hypothetical protein n=1 Tax=Streptomyces TaxID=1883 RepID=UPI00140B2CE7|nr:MULTISPECIES: hypothetical protein [Streptomyces]MDH6227185.1 hypothetical protein [Streptomyces sp. MJP52]